MITRRKTMGAAAALGASGFASHAHAQEDFPSKQVNIVIGFAAGGGADTSSRWLADYVRDKWKVTAIVENRAGAGATIAATQLARAKPDGYTVGLVTTTGYTIAPYFQKVPYNPETDFTYLFQFLVSAEPMFCRADSPYKTAEEFVAWAKANPGKLNWSSGATNGAAQIATEVAFRKLGIAGQYIPFKGGADAMPALLGGHIDILVAAGFTPLVESGRIRLLAESGLERIANFPDIPTYQELGWPIGVQAYYGIAAPAGLPAPIAAKWEALGREMVTDPGFIELMGKLSTKASFKSGADFGKFVAAGYKQMSELIPTLGLKPS
jgi:tripartite-type tricarboxylate transporter receptor subunit TctC